MSNNIKMSPAEVKQTAKIYDTSSKDIDTMLNQLKAAQNKLAADWEGDAFAAFDEQFTILSPKVKEFGELLNDIYNQLNKIADIIDETDQKIGSTIRSGF